MQNIPESSDAEAKNIQKAAEFMHEFAHRTEKMEALGMLAGGMAHDLNNSLGILMGYAELLLEDLAEGDPLRELVENIIKGGGRVNALIQDLLILARRETIPQEKLNLNLIASNFIQSPDCEKLLGAHPDIVMQIEQEEKLHETTGSEEHIEKALKNLAINATESMPNGGIITISTANGYVDDSTAKYEDIAKGDYTLLSVADTGEAISPEHLKRIFEPYYSKRILGRSKNGMNLTVVWGIIKDHGGFIKASSQAGKGNKFTLYFPAVSK